MQGLHEFVLEGLQRHKGTWPEIAKETGVPYDTITKIARLDIEDPGVTKCELLAANIRMRDEQATARSAPSVEAAA